MRYEAIDPQLFLDNRNRLRDLLKPNSLVVLAANDIFPTNGDGTFPFVQNSNLYHLTGIAQEDTYLLFFPDAVDPAEREILFVRESSEQIAIWEGRKLTFEEARHQSGIAQVQWSQNFQATLRKLAAQAEHLYLATNEHPRLEKRIKTANDRLISQCKTDFPLHKFERLAPLMYEIRSVKLDPEIKQIKQACNITKAGFLRVLEFVKPGVGEWEIEAEFIHEFTRRRADGFAYAPIIGAGANSCVLHYGENDAVCKDGDILLMDVAAAYAGYASDLTRCLPVNGAFTPRQRDVYNAVLRVHRAAAKEGLKPGNSLKDFNDIAIELMVKELSDLGLIKISEGDSQKKRRELVKKYYMHGIGHHLGLDVHDVSPPHQKMQVGMVFTVEPGIYIPEENLGIRLENNYVIGENENTDLMADIPIEAEEIESLMQAKS